MSDFALFQRLLVTWGLVAVLWGLGPGTAIVSSFAGETIADTPSHGLVAGIAGVYVVAHVAAIALSVRWIRQNR